MRHLWMLVTIALLAFTGEVRAQAPRAGNPLQGGESAVVIYTVTGRLPGGSGTELLTIPVDLLERLSREPALARLDVSPRPGMLDAVEAAFVFTSERAFREWYESPAGREVGRLLADRLRQPTSSLSFRRSSLAGYVRN